MTSLYETFRATLDATPNTGRFMPYNWSGLPDRLSAVWMAYSQMLNEFARELANIINDFTHYVHQLQAWSEVMAPMTDEEKQEATHEFVDVVATVAVNLPYVIRSRFIFATAHLCHQANMTRDFDNWNDDLPLDSDIYFDAADKHGAGWRRYNLLKRRLEAINGRAFQAATHDFRHLYNHRFSPRFAVGITNFVTRIVDKRNGQVAYAFGGMPPLEMSVVADLLAKERDDCYRAFEAFQGLVREHETAIASFPVT